MTDLNLVNALNDQKWAEEVGYVRSTLDMALRLLCGQKPGITLESLQGALAIETKCKALEAEIAKLSKENASQKVRHAPSFLMLTFRLGKDGSTTQAMGRRRTTT